MYGLPLKIMSEYTQREPISDRLTVSEGTNQRGRQMSKKHQGLTSGPTETKNIRIVRKRGKKVVAVNGIPLKGQVPTADGTIVDADTPTELSEEAMVDLELLADGFTDLDELADIADESALEAIEFHGGRNVF